MTPEREITEPVDLCLPGGRLNPEAIGWTRRPLHRANLRGWGRCKRWEYWGIVTPTHIVGLMAASLDYAGLLNLYVLDRATGVETAKDVVVPLARGVVMPERSGEGTASAQGGGLRIDLTAHTIRAVSPTIELDVEVALPEGHESLGVVVPWGANRLQYTVKDLGRPARGTLRVGGRAHEIDGFAVLDHGRGKWPYDVVWNWAAGCAPGLAVQLGGKWTDGTGSTENALFVDGRLHKIGDELEWRYDRTDWTRPWHITGSRVEVEFLPFHEKVAKMNLGIVANETHQCFGTFTGRAKLDNGSWLPLDGLTGWAEEARNRW